VAAVTRTGGLNERQVRQLRYWSALREFAADSGSAIKLGKPRAAGEMRLSLGRNVGRHAAALQHDSYLPSEPAGLRVDGVLWDDNAKDFFAQFESVKADIETELGYELQWHNDPDVKGCRIMAREAADPTNEVDWARQHEWLLTTLQDFARVFRPRVQTLVI
jgi:hypothetical protein